MGSRGVVVEGVLRARRIGTREVQASLEGSAAPARVRRARDAMKGAAERIPTFCVPPLSNPILANGIRIAIVRTGVIVALSILPFVVLKVVGRKEVARRATPPHVGECWKSWGGGTSSASSIVLASFHSTNSILKTNMSLLRSVPRLPAQAMRRRKSSPLASELQLARAHLLQCTPNAQSCTAVPAFVSFSPLRCRL